MTTTVSSENQVARSRRVLTNKGDVFSSFNMENFTMPRGKDKEWKFTPLRKLHGLHNGTAADPVTASIPVGTAGQDDVAVGVVKHDDERLGRTDTPMDHVTTQAYSNFDDARVVTFAGNLVSKEPVVIDVDGPGEDNVSYGHIVIGVQSHTEAVCVINYRSGGTFVNNIEFVIGDGTKLSVVTMVSWNEDVAHDSAHHIRIGRDAILRHTVTTFDDEAARIVPRVASMTPGGDVGLPDVYFVGAGQYFENRMLVDHAVPNCRSNVMYKGTLQGEPNIVHREVRATWVGGVLIRAETTGTDTCELSHNLLFTEGARADAVPNLGIETGEIAGARHTATVGHFDEEQLFYLLSRGIPELAAHRLVIHGFFSEVINLIPIESVREKLEKLVGEELNIAGF